MFLTTSAGIEPTTLRLTASHSDQLSYEVKQTFNTMCLFETVNDFLTPEGVFSMTRFERVTYGY